MTDRTDHCRRHLLFFLAGGVRFATEASTVHDIADANWQPPTSRASDTKGCLVDLAELLCLPAGNRTRTLVIEADEGLWGFGVEAIPQGHIQAHPVMPLPPLLRSWMFPCVFSGFFQDQETVSGVLDLRQLARVASEKNRPQPGTDTGRQT